MDNRYLLETPILDFSNPSIQSLIKQRQWDQGETKSQIAAIYQFVKDEIPFGYNHSDDIVASQVLADGYGQCNTKGNLLMALLRAIGIECRFHGFTIEKELQNGAIPSILIGITPDYILHSWVEVRMDNQWLNLEGFILDKEYLYAVQSMFCQVSGSFSGYGIATNCLSAPKVEWDGTDTYIQKEGIHDDFGVFDSPDAFYQQHGTNLTGLKRFFYKYLIRHIINSNVQRIRSKTKAQRSFH